MGRLEVGKLDHQVYWIEEEDEAIVAWVLSVQECGLSITLQQIKWKVAKVSQPHFEASVKMRLTLPKVGTWNPPRLSKLQSSIAGVRTPFLEVLFISLERF